MGYIENVTNKRSIEDSLRTEEHPFKVNSKKFDLDRVNILLMSDEHLGHRGYDRDLHERVLENAYDKGWYVLHLGDAIECATKDSVGAGVFEQDEIVDKQVSNSIALYEPFVEDGRFLGMHSSNHPERIYKSTGFDVSRHMCREMDAKYLGIAKAHIFRVGNQTYTIYTTHGASGAMLPYTKIKGALDMEKIIDTEIYAMGHVHQLSHHVRNYNHLDKRSKTIKTGQKHFILTGSYLDYWNSYAQIKNMEPSRKGSPILTLNGLEHQIKVSLQ
jgi:hypothetical protein